MSIRAERAGRRVMGPDPRFAVLLVLAIACSEGAAPGRCGNGRLDPGEVCDDGNATGGDGCSPTCRSEGQATNAVCGNGLRELGEACDDGNTNPRDGCTPECLVRLGWFCPQAGPCRVNCGDGLALEGEACDDGNATSGDGCSEACAIEDGWSCQQTSSGGSCTSICGDGQIVGGETCDDGNQREGDGCSPSCLARDVWLPIGDLAGSPTLTGATAVWSGSEMIVWGGTTRVGRLATGFRFEPRSGRVAATSIVGAPWARDEHLAVWSGTEMLVFGGAGPAHGDGGRYDPLRDTWRAMSSLDASTPRALASGVWTGSELIVWGGYDPTSQAPVHLGSGGRYDPAVDVWRPMTPTGAPSPRAAPVIVSTGNAVLIWGGIEVGGRDSNGNLIVTRHPVDGARYDPSRDAWIPISTRGAAPARQGTAVWTGRELIVVPCRDGATLLGGARYDPARDLWSPIANFPREPKDCALTRASWTGSELVVVAGDSTTIYVPVLNNWILGPSSNDLSRRDAVQVWTGDELLVWGGEGWDPPLRVLQDGLRWRLNTLSWGPLGASVGIQQNQEGTVLWTGSEALFWTGRDLEQAHGFRFDPRTSAWRRMSTVNAPVGDNGFHSSVWTGSELIIWGGGVRREEGAIYTPATDTWRRLPPNPGAIERTLHAAAAAWTGSEMLIWGGIQALWVGGTLDRRALDEGWRFDPLLDRWTEMSRVGAPEPRREALAIWTGEEAIVLAGWTFNGYPPRDAASYDPVLDRWRPILPPPGRADLSDVRGGVWTGSRLFVLAQGWTAFYDPQAGQWEFLPSENQPVVSRASCVWTGTDVIVWGGFSADGLTSNGARYDLALGRWIPIPSEGAPSARSDHAAVWTGSEMIIWGGFDGGLGGRFLR